MKLERNDNLYNMIELIETSSNNIVSANATLLKSVNRLLEVEQGTWKIESVGRALVFKFVPYNRQRSSSQAPCTKQA